MAKGRTSYAEEFILDFLYEEQRDLAIAEVAEAEEEEGDYYEE